MNLKAFREGLEILSQYYDKPDGYHLGAEHDVIQADATDRPLSESDLLLMIGLGWHQAHDDRDYDVSFGVADYKPDEPWQAFV